MSLKARFRIAIVALATLIVVAMSGLYVRGFLSASFERTDQIAKSLGQYIEGAVAHRLNRLDQRPSSIEAAKNLWLDTVEHDEGIQSMLQRSLGAWPQIVEIDVTDNTGRILASSRDGMAGKRHPPTVRFDTWRQRSLLSNIRHVFFLSEDSEVLRTLGVAGETVLRIHVVLSSLLLRNLLLPELQRLTALSVVALLISIALALILPSLIVDPLERLTQRIDRMTELPGAPPITPVRELKEFAVVHSKLNLLGQQVAGAREDASELRSNVAQLLEQLKEAVLLFDAAGKLMMAGPAVRHLLGSEPDALIGRRASEIFPPNTPLGALLIQAIDRREGVRDRLVTIVAAGVEHQVLASIEPIARRAAAAAVGAPSIPQSLGILVTLRDAETRGQIEEQLGIADRLTAMSHLTRAVAHEIKNPLNAITVHLEVMKERIGVDEAPELNVIASEIARLNRIVKTFLDFHRPVDVRRRRVDLNELVNEVTKLVTPQASAHDVSVACTSFGRPVWIDGDRDLLKQAFLNVVMNALEAMPDGGDLTVLCRAEDGTCRIEISDTGPGIAPEIRDKIFNLYFTTKGNGSGIGLAMAYRFVQLHDGKMTFSSEPGQGATFIFELVEAASQPLTNSVRLTRGA
jgi:signal transduction histidine kinase